MQGARKGRIALIVVACVLTVVLAVGGIVVKRHVGQQRWMRDVVYSQAADKLYRKNIKSFDPKAFTKEGVIHSYCVKDGDFAWTPMHTIDVVITINDDPDLTIETYLGKDLDENGRERPMKTGASALSEDLEDRLIKVYPHLHDDSAGERG